MSKSDKINIVSGGYAVCLSCSARLTSVPRACPQCGSVLVPGAYRLVPDDDRSPRKKRCR